MAIDEKLEEAKKESFVYDQPPVDPNYEEQSTPGPVARGLSKALMQSAFSKFGQAFTDTGDVRKDAQTRDQRLAPYMQSGGEAAAALEARWHTMEFENFKAQHIEPWVAQKKEMIDDYQRRHAQADEGVFEGPDGAPVQVNILTKEGRLKAVRMRGQLEKRFYSLNTDMDLELFNEAGKYGNNPMITDRAMAIQQATSNQLMTVANPAQTLDAEDKMSVMRGREAEAEARMAQAKATAAARPQKRPVSFAEALKHPDIGPGGIMQWFISDPAGLGVLHAEGGGASFVKEQLETAKGILMRDNPDLKEGTPELESKLARMEPQIVAKAAAKYLEHLDPNAYATAQQVTPHFFDQRAKDRERGIVDDKRQAPKVRQRNIDTWKDHAETHFNEYMENPNNDSSIDAALDNLDQWLRAAVYGDTDDPKLQAVTAARGEGTRRYVSDIFDQIPEHIRKWWATKEGSGIAQEENPREADIARRAAGKGGRRGRQRARILERERKRKKEKGLLP